jgi:hypothetical protein
MKIIAHRGNIDGKSWMENNPKHILRAINNGFDVEVDIRYIDKKWYLGHDNPTYVVNFLFLESINKNAWFHCKNLEALSELDPLTYKFFWHQNDDFTLTSNGYIWTYPEKNVTPRSIIVDLNLDHKYNNIYGICTDYPSLVE